jgi:periplasmic protein TonB
LGSFEKVGEFEKVGKFIKSDYFVGMRYGLLLYVMVLALSVRAQEKDLFYLMDRNWKPAKMDSAIFFYRIRKVNDTSWQCDSYNLFGPLIRSERYRDKEANVQEGTSYYYSADGLLDSTMQFQNNRRNGESVKYSSDSMHAICKYIYKDDSLIAFEDYRNRKHASDKTDSVEQESEYPGGGGKWLRYLNKHLKYPERALKSNKDGEVRVLFVVDKQGAVSSPVIGKSVEWSLDDEAMRVIVESGTWNPAFQNGKIVKSYKIQPIVYKLQ